MNAPVIWGMRLRLWRLKRLTVHPKRHPMDMEFTVGCDENGIIQGVMATVIADTGAYASLGGPVLERACTHAAMRRGRFAVLA
ncbi:MAG: molybdopterin-dependent oxidoreductase [Eubacterium sp.]|nr:molybdopterin-dependent oxidoreductase [Eubacterium sp.]